MFRWDLTGLPFHAFIPSLCTICSSEYGQSLGGPSKLYQNPKKNFPCAWFELSACTHGNETPSLQSSSYTPCISQARWNECFPETHLRQISLSSTLCYLLELLLHHQYLKLIRAFFILLLPAKYLYRPEHPLLYEMLALATNFKKCNHRLCPAIKCSNS